MIVSSFVTVVGTVLVISTVEFAWTVLVTVVGRVIVVALVVTFPAAVLVTNTVAVAFW